MVGLPARHLLLTCTLLSCSLPHPGALAWRHITHAGAPDGGGEDARRPLLLESVKAGILSSLGMERAPRPTVQASDEALRRMYRLYREKMKTLRGNSSTAIREFRITSKRQFTVLFPETVEPITVIQSEGQSPESDQHIQWYRAVFNKGHVTQGDMTLVRARLKISGWRSDAAQPEIRQEVRVKVNGMRPVIATAKTHGSMTNTTAAHAKDLSVDIRAEVGKCWRDNDVQSLVVEIGLVAGEVENLKADPTVALEVGLAEPAAGGRRRRPRSSEEDACSEQGWCCRMSLTVSFREIGWSDWVVAPTSYTMHFCDGSCPHNYKPASMHTQVKSRLHQMSEGGMPGPCCVPSAYEPLILMHYDSKGRMKLTPFPDLIVSRCHCA